MSSAFLGVYFDKLEIVPYPFDEIMKAIRGNYATLSMGVNNAVL